MTARRRAGDGPVADGGRITSRTARRARRAGAELLGVGVRSTTLALLSANRPRRQVYRVGAGGRALIVKCYPGPLRTTLAAIRLTAFAGAPDVVIPTCLRVDVPGRLIAMDLLEGTPLLEVLAGPGAEAAAEQVGRALGSLHRHPAELPVRRRRARILRFATKFRHLAAEEDRARIDRAVGVATSTMAAIPELDPVPSHGDLGPAQILFRAGSLAIYDFDEAAYAESALDLGNLLAQIVRRHGRRGFELHAALVRGYATRAVPPPPALVRAYAIAILARKLARRPASERAVLRTAIDLLVAESSAPPAGA